ncbi:flavodoxin family protein [Clostridium botulinum]|uniref:Flavodoxin family protein n=1 Tax=Clostridium botulinum TaxID=1491 RepID=A0A6G4HRV1_CLOBO|nr:flavodoxin family protein [Clostridium botulinum]MBD5586059.1 flavodoxin family protein [Clostridium botulinum]MBO0570406.1 flavodoxin family protein [Clostridium botulinum]MBO0581711.1 flavodoxin family protein [Clostridium botulinum]NFJ59715.1 flavodoxin family protein [Clostridium botulinum]NFJ67518.1 flavodoxin family protein [Clostridium botulinum]
MKKIFAYVGSQKGKNSYTWKLTKNILEQVISLSDGEIQYNLISPDQIKINFCASCKCCFENGFCPQDDFDSMESIKEDMLQSDLIILASPVYAHNVTGNMKVFIDRLTYWMHIFRLAGKLGVTISTSDSNGNEYINKYLNKFMQYCGINVICNFKAIQMINPLTTNNTFNNLDIMPISYLICDYLINNHQISATDFQETLFQNLKSYMLTLKENNIPSSETKYWEEHGYFNADSYNTILFKLQEENCKVLD